MANSLSNTKRALWKHFDNCVSKYMDEREKDVLNNEHELLISGEEVAARFTNADLAELFRSLTHTIVTGTDRLRYRIHERDVIIEDLEFQVSNLEDANDELKKVNTTQERDILVMRDDLEKHAEEIANFDRNLTDLKLQLESLTEE